MNNNLKPIQIEALKRACMSSAKAQAAEHGFESCKTLWEAILNAFFGKYSIKFDDLFAEDIEFLELYRKYLKEDGDSVIWTDVVDQIIVRREFLRHNGKMKILEDCLTLSRHYLNAANYDQAIKFSSQIILNELSWLLQSSFSKLDRAEPAIDLLLTAHERKKQAAPKFYEGNYHIDGIPPAQTLLERSFQGYNNLRHSYDAYDLLKTTRHLARLHHLTGNPKKAVECLASTCNALNDPSNENAVLPDNLRGHRAGIKDPSELPALWLYLANIQLELRKPTDAADSCRHAVRICEKYMTILTAWFETNMISKEWKKYLEGKRDGLDDYRFKDFPVHERLQGLKSEAETLIQNIKDTGENDA
ncbi:MAG: hypothetical protein K2Y22_15470 [Candidatus Obscuribacterales bacterium]|nr:hypothetical protein [Candidatus Obscuribacterales bacterium]